MKFETYFKRTTLLMIVVLLLYAGITSVWGVQGAPSISVGGSSRASFDNTSTATTGVQAGNVTELNISGWSITSHWAGFFGEISGNMTLADSGGNMFYDWTGLNDVAGEVFSSTDDAVSWGGIGCASSAEVDTLETFLNITPSDPDRVNQTYTSTTHPSFTVGGAAISTCNSTNAYVDTGKDGSTFYQILLTDTEGDAVYTTLINDTTTGFDAATHDFELLVGEPNTAGTTAMYFYIELS